MKSEKEKMLNGELYTAGDKTLLEERKYAKKLLKQLLTVDDPQPILRQLLPNTHSSLYIEFPFHCDYGYNIHCGENVFFNTNCVVLDVAKIVIGSNVFFGPAVQIYTATHPVDAITRRTLESGKPISIGDDCWIGGGAIILPGVNIGDRCIVGAGSVVTKNIPDDSIVVGNPARIITKNQK